LPEPANKIRPLKSPNFFSETLAFLLDNRWEIGGPILYVAFNVLYLYKSPGLTFVDAFHKFLEGALEHSKYIVLYVLIVILVRRARREVMESITKAILSDDYKAALNEAFKKFFYNEKLLDIPPEDYIDHMQQNIDSHVQGIIHNRMYSALNSVKQCKEGMRFDVDSSELYRYVRDSLTKCNEFLIIDHDINRWKEIDKEISDQGARPTSNGDNTFNYSNDILAITLEQATLEGRDFMLKRLFLLKEDEWQHLACQNPGTKCQRNKCRHHEDCKIPDPLPDGRGLFTIIREIGEVESEINRKKGRRVVETKFCVYDWLKQSKHHVAKDVLHLQDIVVVNHSFVFREKFNVETRARSEDTTSEISCVSPDVQKCIGSFNYIWGKASKQLPITS